MRSEGKSVLDEPVRGAAADVAVLALPGVEQVRALSEGRLSEPPNARLTGRRLLGVSEGSVVFGLPASYWLLGPKGTLHPGVVALLADSATAGAVITTLPPGVLFVTAELSVTFLAEMPEAGGDLIARASAVHVDDRHGLATAEIQGPNGTLLGFATSRVFLQAPIDTGRLGTLTPPPPDPDWPTPDPWARPPDGAIAAVEAKPDGPGSLRQTASGLMAKPPIDRLLGIRLVETSRGEATFAMPASGWLTNEFGSVSGGILALLGKSATAAAGQAAARPGTSFRALDVKVNFIRGVPADGQDIIARGHVTHRGRLTVASAVIEHAGRTVAVATGSTMLGS